MHREIRCAIGFVIYCSCLVVSWDITKGACGFCVGDECWSVPREKCLYFSITSTIIGRGNCAVFGIDSTERPKDGAREADHALFEIVSEALSISDNAECLPLLSEYTDCRKDNVCTGCKECTCSETGHWACALVQRCSPSTKPRVNHRLLALMMAALLDQGYKNGSVNETALTNSVDVSQDLIDNKLVNVKKREIQSEKSQNDTINDDERHTEDLKNNALEPLNKVIAQKYSEINNLRYIENYLIRYLISQGAINATYNLSNDLESFVQSSESPNFVIYKFETDSELEPKIARTKTNILQKLTKRILQGISQVATDIDYYGKAMYKHNKSKLPEDLRKIMNMLKNYINKQNKNKKISKRTYAKQGETFNNDTNLPNGTSTAIENKIDNSLTNILKNINDSKISDDVNLSKHGHKVFERIAKHAFFKHTLDVTLKESDLNYMDQLRNIGHDWITLSKEVVKSNVNSVLDYLKLIHLSISADVNTMHDILIKINNEKIISNEAVYLVDKINSKLAILSTAIKNVSIVNEPLFKTEEITTTQKSTSAIPQPTEHSIKEVLKKSRNDIFTILKNKFKHDLPRGLVHNHFDNYNKEKYKKFKSLMLQWQKKLNVQPRVKRSATIHSKLRRIRLRNILPKYLRKKVSPVINERKLRNITANANQYRDLNNNVYVF